MYFLLKSAAKVCIYIIIFQINKQKSLFLRCVFYVFKHKMDGTDA